MNIGCLKYIGYDMEDLWDIKIGINIWTIQKGVNSFFSSHLHS